MQGKIVGAGSEQDRSSFPVYTRKESRIRNEKRNPFPPDKMQVHVEKMLDLAGDASLRSAASTYNCLGMIFASRRTLVYVKELGKIFREDDYEKVRRLSDVQVGDVAVYTREGEPKHVGVVVDVDPSLLGGDSSIKIMSQWGRNGEYLHDVDDVPEGLGSVGSYYTDRRSTENAA